jgi:hypothetical protein
MAVPERINLFRVQALRGVGGNGDSFTRRLNRCCRQPFSDRCQRGNVWQVGG